MTLGLQLDFALAHLSRRDLDLITIYAATLEDENPLLIVYAEEDRFIVSNALMLADDDNRARHVEAMKAAGHSQVLIEILCDAGKEGAGLVNFKNDHPRDPRYGFLKLA